MKKFQAIVDFIRAQYNIPEAFIPLHEPRFFGNEKKYLNECIDSTFVSSVGKFVDQFELDMAKYTGVKKAIAVVNGTSALHLALKLVGVNSGDEVITQALTFIATANTISYCDAKPVFIDVDLDTMGLSPKSLLHFLETETEQRDNECYNKKTNRKITACVPMHTFGHPCRIDKIAEICKRHHIKLVEDAAESLGSLYKNRHTGSFGDIGILSFNGNKTITAGGGGMLLFNSEKLALKAKHLTTQAKIPHAWEFRHDEIGYNYRMPNINAALGVAQLELLPKILSAKRKLAQSYATFFSSLYPESIGGSASAFSFFTEPLDVKSNYWLNVLILKDRAERNKFLSFTNEKGVMTRPIWELMNKLPMFKNCKCGDLSNSEWLVDRVVNIPSSIL